MASSAPCDFNIYLNTFVPISRKIINNNNDTHVTSYWSYLFWHDESFKVWFITKTIFPPVSQL